METTQILPPSEETWLEFKRYGGPTNLIADRLSEIVHSIASQMGARIDKRKNDPSMIFMTAEYKLENQFKVKIHISLKETSKVQCAYCQQMQENNTSYTITNINTGDAMAMPAIAVHMISQHSYLGDFGPYRLTPTQACKVLGIEN